VAAGRRLYLKREDVHELGAFKWRGALPVLERYRDAGAEAVVTASTGNHGAATAWAAQRTGLRAIIYAPEGASEAKVGLVRSLGAELRLVGPDLDVAKDEARAFAAENGLPFFEDGAEPAQFDAYEGIGDEIVDQLGEPPAAVVVPVGNGALFIGVARSLARGAPAAARVAVVAKEAPVMALSIEAGRVVESDRSATFADGMAVRVAIPLAVEELAPLVSSVLLVSERAMARAIGALAAEGIRVEASGAAPLAALDQLGEVDGPVVLVVTGRNIDEEMHRRAVECPDSFPD
jgi:threonine dehydratase